MRGKPLAPFHSGIAMRDTLDGILEAIGAESLTDEEFYSVEIDDINDPSEVYAALLLVLDSRGLVGNMPDRLRYYYLSKGIVFGEEERSKSNIFVGAPI